MKCKQFLRNQPTENFNEAPKFRVKQNWNSPKRHLTIETLLSKVKTEIFSVFPGILLDYNKCKEEWLAWRGLAEDQNIITRPPDKSSCIVIWD